jgi:hypothetical protein
MATEPASVFQASFPLFTHKGCWTGNWECAANLFWLNNGDDGLTPPSPDVPVESSPVNLVEEHPRRFLGFRFDCVRADMASLISKLVLGRVLHV